MAEGAGSGFCKVIGAVVVTFVVTALAFGLGFGLGMKDDDDDSSMGLQKVGKIGPSTTDLLVVMNLGISKFVVRADNEIYNLEIMAWDDKLLGPVVDLYAGEGNIEWILQINNNLPQETAVPTDPGPCYDWATAGGKPASSNIDNMHGARTTNIHQHGLHVAAEVDSIDIQIAPGETHQYVYSTKPSQTTHFAIFHPHKHGAVTTHMGNGLAGAITVRRAPGLGIEDALPAGTKEILVAVTELDLWKNDATCQSSCSYSNDPLSFACGEIGGHKFGPPFELSMMLVNGAPNSVQHWDWEASFEEQGNFFNYDTMPFQVVEVPAGGYGWMRIINARARDPLFYDLTGTDYANVHVVSVDGYTFATPAPFSKGLPFSPGYFHEYDELGRTITPGGRSEIVVHVPLDATVGSFIDLIHNQDHPNILTRIVVTAAESDTVEPMPLAMPVPVELKAIPGDEVTNTRFFSLQSYFGQDMVDMGIATKMDPIELAILPDLTQFIGNAGGFLGWSNGFFMNIDNDSNTVYIDGISADIDAGATEEWIVDNISPQMHPFHVHILPQYVIGLYQLTYPAPGKRYTTSLPVEGENLIETAFWADVVTLPAEHRLIVRIAFKNMAPGAAVMHCHITEHEDNGMMMRFRYATDEPFADEHGGERK